MKSEGNLSRMTKVEQQIYNFIKKNLGLFCIIAVTFIRLGICFYLRRYESGDFQQDLQQWFDEIKMNGGLAAMKQQVGNYNIPYLPCMKDTAIWWISCCYYLYLLTGVSGSLQRLKSYPVCCAIRHICLEELRYQQFTLLCI